MALSPPTQDLLLLAANGKKHVSISISSGTDGSTRVVATGINTTGLACFLGSDESLGDDPKPYTIVEHGTKPMVVLQGIEHAAVLDPDYNQDAYFAESQKCWEYVVAPFTGVDPEPLTPAQCVHVMEIIHHYCAGQNKQVLTSSTSITLGRRLTKSLNDGQSYARTLTVADPVLMERALSLASHLDAARALENSPAFSLMDCITNSITQSGHSDCEAVSSQLLSSSGALHSYLPYVPQEGQAGHEAKQAVGHAVCEALVACVERYCRQPVPNGAHKVRKGWDAGELRVCLRFLDSLTNSICSGNHSVQRHLCSLHRVFESNAIPRKRVLALMKPILLAEICLITRLGRTWAQPMLDAVQPQQRGELPADSPFTHHSITNIWQRRSIRHYKLDYQRDRLFEILRSPGCQGADPYRLLCTIPALARWATNLITINTFSANPDSLIKDYVLYGHAYDKVQRHLRSGNYAGTAAGVLRDAGRELGAAAARWRQHAKQYVADPDQPLDPGLIRRLYTHQPAAEVAGLTEAIAGRVAVHHILDLGCNECGFLWAGRSTDAGVIRAIKARVAAISSARSSARAAAREHTPKCPLNTSRHQGARPFLVVVQHVAVSGSAPAPQAGTSSKRPRELAIQEGRTAWKMARTSAISKDPACNAQRTWVCGGGCGYKSYAGVCYNTQSRTAEEFRLAPDAVCPLCASHMRPAPAL